MCGSERDARRALVVGGECGDALARSEVVHHDVLVAAVHHGQAPILGRDGEIGRTLEFLGQEMLREANTIGSKSADVDLARDVIALKGDIDRLKEQVANLE